MLQDLRFVYPIVNDSRHNLGLCALGTCCCACLILAVSGNIRALSENMEAGCGRNMHRTLSAAHSSI